MDNADSNKERVEPFDASEPIEGVDGADPKTEQAPTAAAPQPKQSSIDRIGVIIKDLSGASVVAEGALALILKIKQILTYHHADITVEIQNLDKDALAGYDQELKEANAWLAARGLPTVQG